MADEANSVWMLITAGPLGVAAPLTAAIGAGARGEVVRRIALDGASGEALASAGVAVRLAYRLLYREKYVDREIEVRLRAQADLTNLHGRSGDLAFALALTAGLCAADGTPSFQLPPVAATGVLNDSGGVEAVERLTAKITAGLDALPSGGIILFPRANESEITPSLRAAAAARSVALTPVARLEEALQRLGLALSQTWLDAPFRGLEPFGFEHASIFFGRELEIDAVLSLLARRVAAGRPAVLVQGTSGSGKSSLLLAGVLPALLRRGLDATAGERIRWGVLRPRSVEPDVDAAREQAWLAAALQDAWAHGMQGGVAAAPAASLDAEAILRGLKAGAGGCATYVLVLDQMEQWFDGRLQPSTVAALTALVAGLCERGVWVLASATRAGLGSPDARALLGLFGVEGCYSLSQALAPARLEAVIREPAKAARLEFDPGLDAEIFAAASHGGADVLPLLELLLTELHERRDRVNNRLRMADYRVVGGLEGVVAARAEAAYAACDEPAKALSSTLLWRLAATGEAAPQDYPSASPMRRLLAALRDRRLLVEDRGELGQETLHPAHEALFRQWPRAAAFLRDNAADISLWLDLLREAGQWARGERALIPAGPQLDAAKILLDRRAGDWTSRDRPVLDYVTASLARQRNRRRLVFAAAAATGLAGTGAAGFELYGLAMDLRRKRITFADAEVGPPNYTIAAAPYLRQHGIRLADFEPDSTAVVIKGNSGYYRGRAVETSSSDNFLTQESAPTVAPVSFLLAFDEPVRQVWLLRCKLWAQSISGVTGPAWTATARNASGDSVASGGEALLRSCSGPPALAGNGGCGVLPAQWVRLTAGRGQQISSVTIQSDCRKGGQLFAGSEAVLIQEIQLWR